jgi:Mycothiol maleylpyruvate isomerase N-terminal domain
VRDRDLLIELGREWDTLGRRLHAEAPAFRGGPPFPATGPGLFAELEEVLSLWRGLRRSGLARHRHLYVNGGWTLRDLVAHMASWAAEFRQQAETIAAGREFEYAIPFALSLIGPNQWNAEQVAARRDLSFREVLDQFEEETERLQDLVLTLPREVLLRPAALPLAPDGDPRTRFPGSIAVAASAKCRHDRHHLGQLQRWLAERAARPATRPKKKGRSRT